jgi:DNA-binding Lrp family transcriptional regulator
VKAFVFIEVRPGKSPEVVSQVKRIERVTSAHVCWGHPDIIAILEAASDVALSEAVLKKIQAIPGVESTDTHLVIE